MKNNSAESVEITFSDIDVRPHPQKSFDLRVEPWIPVRDTAGKRSVVGLRTFFENAHKYVDIDTDNPLESLVLYRYLISLTIFMVNKFNSEDWDTKWVSILKEDETSFPSEPLIELWSRIEEHCWLWHPHTPFMQTPEILVELATAITKKDTKDSIGDPYEVLLAHVPSNTNESIWYKTLSVPTESDLSRALLLRHYAAAAGNLAKNSLSASSYSAGGQIMPGPRSSTQLMWKSGTIAQTLLCNIMVTPVEYEGEGGLSFFWECPKDMTKQDDPLWLYTYSCATSFIVKTSNTLEPYRVLRSNLLVNADLQKEMFSVSCARDPHVMLFRKSKEGSIETGLKGTKRVVFAANVSQFRNVFALYRVAQNPNALEPCIINKDNLQYGDAFTGLPLRATTVTAGGTSTGVRHESVVSMDIDAEPFLLCPTKHDILRGVMESLAGTTSSVRHELLRHIKAIGLPEGTIKSLSSSVDVLLWSELAESINAIYADVCTGTKVTPALTPEDKRTWLTAAESVYMKVCEPYMGSAGVVAKVYRNKSALEAKLRGLL